MDLSSRLRAIVKSGPPKPVPSALTERDVHASRKGELTYEPDTGRYEASLDLDQVAAVLGGRPADTPFGRCLIVDRRELKAAIANALRFMGARRAAPAAFEAAPAAAVAAETTS